MSTATAVLDVPMTELDDPHENAHDAWIRAELARRAANPGKLIPHEEVMAQARALIEELKARHARA